MNIINIIEIIVSIILFIMILMILRKRGKRNNKILTIITIINLILLVHLGVTNIERTVKENTLKEKQVSAKIEYDIVPPVITLKGDKKVILKEGEQYTEAGYSAIDDNDGSIVSKVNVSKQILSETQYKLIYTVEDNSGNAAKEERIIVIQKKAEEEKPQQNENNNKQTNQNSNKDNKDNKEKEKDKNKGGIIYLTFDDGPTSSSTPKILDILKKNDVKATFFIINYTDATESLVKREIAEGHSVGIHGYSHDYKKIYKSVDSYMENLNKLQTKIEKSTGVKTTLTRFPGGSSNTISSFNPGIMTKLSKEIVDQGYRYYDWNVSAGDADGAKDSDAVYKNVIRELYSKGSNVVLMHDFANNDKTINALEKIIQYGKKHGYTFKPITEETPMMKHKIFN